MLSAPCYHNPAPKSTGLVLPSFQAGRRLVTVQRDKSGPEVQPPAVRTPQIIETSSSVAHRNRKVARADVKPVLAAFPSPHAPSRPITSTRRDGKVLKDIQIKRRRYTNTSAQPPVSMRGPKGSQKAPGDTGEARAGRSGPAPAPGAASEPSRP